MRTSMVLGLVAFLAGCSPAYGFVVAHSPEPSQTRDVIALETGTPSPATTFPVQPQPDVDGPQMRAHSGGSAIGNAAAFAALTNNPGSIGAFTVIAVAVAVAAAGKK